MKAITLFGVLLFVFGFGTPADAQTKSVRDNHFYGILKGGMNTIDIEGIDVEEDSGPLLGASLGHNFSLSGSGAIQVEIDFSAISDAFGDTIYRGMSWGLNGRYLFPVKGRLFPYLSLGVGVTDAEAHVSGFVFAGGRIFPVSFTVEDDGTYFQGGIGLLFEPKTIRIKPMLEYRYHDVDFEDFDASANLFTFSLQIPF